MQNPFRFPDYPFAEGNAIADTQQAAPQPVRHIVLHSIHPSALFAYFDNFIAIERQLCAIIAEMDQPHRVASVCRRMENGTGNGNIRVELFPRWRKNQFSRNIERLKAAYRHSERDHRLVRPVPQNR